jgi:cytochrome c2
VLAPTIGIGPHLPVKVTDIKSRKPRCARAVSAAVQTVTGKARIGRACAGTAQGNQFPARRKPAMGRIVDIGASRRCCQQYGGKRASEESRAGHAGRTAACSYRFHHGSIPASTAAALMLLGLLAGCKPPPDERHQMPEASAERGREVIARAGCTSCHAIPGIRWPQGQVGPSLHGFAASNLISGKLPNRPDVLAAYVANAPAVLPGTTMPAMPINREEARDVAAYLYTLKP